MGIQEQAKKKLRFSEDSASGWLLDESKTKNPRCILKEKESGWKGRVVVDGGDAVVVL